uniref:Uncharacterized protein n=1 Tax=Anguilla anguilla TaxID=7936 RepID=A0A0E9TH72_ANGAN
MSNSQSHCRSVNSAKFVFFCVFFAPTLVL